MADNRNTVPRRSEGVYLSLAEPSPCMTCGQELIGAPFFVTFEVEDGPVSICSMCVARANILLQEAAT